MMATTSVRIDQDLEQQLQKLADVTGRTKAWYIREALKSYISHEEWMVQAIQNGVREADAGEFASDEKVQTAFKKHGVIVEG